jgi:tape measure domain-containing protein
MANVAQLSATMGLDAKQFFAETSRINQSLSRLEKNFSNTSTKMRSMFDNAFTGAVAGFTAAAANKLFNAIQAPVDKAMGYLSKGITKAMNLETAQVQLEVMLGSATKAAALMSSLNAMTGRVGNINQHDAATKLIGFGVGEGEVLGVIGQIANISGGDAEKFNRIALQFGQIQAKGKLLAEDLNIIAESGVNLREVLAKQLGVSVAEVSELMGKGKVSADDFKKALKELSETKFAGMLERGSNTMAGLIGRIEQAGIEAGRQFAEGFSKGAKLDTGDLSVAARGMEGINKAGLWSQWGNSHARAINGTFRVGLGPKDANGKAQASIGALDAMKMGWEALWQPFTSLAESQDRVAKQQAMRERNKLTAFEESQSKLDEIDRWDNRFRRAETLASFSGASGSAMDVLFGTEGTRRRGRRGQLVGRATGGSDGLLSGLGESDPLGMLGELIGGSARIGSLLSGAGSEAFRGVLPSAARPDLRNTTSALTKGSSEALNAMIQAKWGPKDEAEKSKKEATEKNTKALHDLTEAVKSGARSGLRTLGSLFGGGE